MNTAELLALLKLAQAQALTAHHHGVDIKTVRQGADREDQ